MRTTNSTGDQIWSYPIRFDIYNLLLSNTLLAARAYNRPCNSWVQWSVTFFVIIAICINNSVYARSPDPFFLRLKGMVCEITQCVGRPVVGS